MSTPSDWRALRRAEAADRLADIDAPTLEQALRAAGKRMDDHRATSPADDPHRVAAEAGYQAIRDELERRRDSSTAAGIEAMQFQPDDVSLATAGTHEETHCFACGAELAEPWGSCSSCGYPDETRDEERAELEQARAELEHSGSRRLEVLEQEAPELVAPPAPIAADVSTDQLEALAERAERYAEQNAERFPETAAHQRRAAGEWRAELERRRAGTPAADELVLTLTHAEAELLAAVLDFGGVDNDNLSDADRDTAARIVERLRFEP